MLKNRFITHSLCTMFFVAAPLAVAVTPGQADWTTKVVDYETHSVDYNTTHLNSLEFGEGQYMQQGAWKWRMWPTCSNGGYCYLSVEAQPPGRQGIAFWMVKIPKTGFYKIQTSYLATENRTWDADYAVYTNVTPAEAQNGTKEPLFAESINQEGGGVPWATLGTFCLKENDASMLVLDGRDDSLSDSADATRWTYVGTEYNSQSCTGGGALSPVNLLLLNKPR